jgi:sigma-B regulation protein RsbU (phosphoserine phosphatase)
MINNLLKMKLNLLFLCIGLAGLLIIVLENVYILNESWEATITYTLPFVFIQVLVLTAAYYLYTIIKLKRFFIIRDSEQPDEEERSKLFHLANRFPASFFLFSTVFMIGLSVTYHLYYDFWLEGNFRGSLYWYKTIPYFLYEQALGLTMTLIYYSAFVKILKPFIIKLNQTSSRNNMLFSYYHRIIIMIVSIILIVSTVLSQLYITSARLAVPVSPLKLFLLIALFLAMACFIVKYTVSDMIDSIKEITIQLITIVKNNGNSIHALLPITSLDEVGELISTYNKIQMKIESMHKETEEDLWLAYQVQQHLLPSKTYHYRELEVDIHYQPAKEVGGDFYFIQEFDPGRLIVAIGDVSGKGLPAALVVSVILGYLGAQVKSFHSSPSSLLAEMNKLIIPILRKGMFVSVGLAVIDINRLKVTYASAGHMHPIIQWKDQTLDYISASSSLPLGIVEEEIFQDTEIHISDQISSLLLYTDGLVEQINNDGQLFGFERLEKMMRHPANFAAKDIVQELQKYSNGVKQLDDITVMLFRLANGGLNPL